MATITSQDSVPTQDEPIQKPIDWGKAVMTAIRYIVLTAVALLVFMPFVLAFLGSFKTNAEIIAFPPTFLPEVWQFQNWPALFQTDLGGTPRPEGTTSVGLIVGLFAFYLTFLATSLSSSVGLEDRPIQKWGPWIACTLIVLGGAAAGGYILFMVENVRTVVPYSVGISMILLMLIALGIISMSAPDWRRVLISMIGSLVAAAVVTVLFTFLARLAGGGTFARWFFNTAVLSVIRACLQIFFCSMAAYALARLEFPGKNLIFGFILLSMTIPGAITLIPSYVLIARLGWINTWHSLVFPGLIVPGSIFMLTQFLKAIPRDLEEAAKIDGASYFQMYRDLVLPLARPALLTVFILQFQAMWNDYLGPLLYFNTPDMWVLNIALQIFQSQYSSDWNLVLVGAMINAVPVLVLFAFFSRYYIEGVSYAGVKG